MPYYITSNTKYIIELLPKLITWIPECKLFTWTYSLYNVSRVTTWRMMAIFKVQNIIICNDSLCLVRWISKRFGRFWMVIKVIDITAKVDYTRLTVGELMNLLFSWKLQWQWRLVPLYYGVTTCTQIRPSTQRCGLARWLITDV